MPVYSWKLTKLVHLLPFFFSENIIKIDWIICLFKLGYKKFFIEVINFFFNNMNHLTRFKVVSKLSESIDMIYTYEPGNLKWSF